MLITIILYHLVGTQMFDCSKVVPKKCQADCCYYVPLNREFWEKHKHLIQQEAIPLNWENGEINFRKDFDGYILPLTKNLRCPFLDKKSKCVIYFDRPYICRVFGTIYFKGLECYHLKPDGSMRGKEDRERRIKENECQLNKIVERINEGGKMLSKLKRKVSR
jgi:Fe-S-cluster containining protein